MKYIVGIESTAHTFGVGVLNMSPRDDSGEPNGKILSNVKDSYTTSEGGMIPLEVRAHHAQVCDEVFGRALREAGVEEGDVEVVAFSNAPGLAPCLLEGMDFSKKLAKRLGIPIVGVNHCVAHLVIGDTVGARDPVMLYASGANTQVVAYEGGKFRIFGETLDLGVGNFIDSIGRTMGLGFPGGPQIQKLASEFAGGSGGRWFGGSDDRGNVPELLELPYVVKGMDAPSVRSQVEGRRSQDDLGNVELLDLPYVVKGMDVSFSGIQTKIRNLLERGEDKGKIAFALQESVFAMLVEVAERALAHTGKKELLIGGGVGCNSRLQEMCRVMCAERGVKFFCPSRDLLVDNGAMIGYLGLKMYKASQVAGCRLPVAEDVDIAPRERTDEVEVLWK